ncbi:hypothetical protein DNH61_15300 [Paenibacillus sambharensis]|uniref:Butirosin biosynthesis protein H N-terminal domain-containing protein n=1 Tax=Paenibacillus sambharensis TaxID=1803190 RepID=A0A2W1LKH0_9BACL|nr:hypothetical protein [Paenibacillus sambharensis]PZD95004.1 hypothetical protein DNH61_15300 [Paenibacillus sambharensis]
MSRRILAVSYPLVSVYPKHAIPFSILSCYDSSQAWIYSNYIQLRCSKTFLAYHPSDAFDFFTLYPEFYENSFFCSERVTADSLTNWYPYAVNFFVDCINRGLYLYTHVDEFWIPGTAAYQRKHFPHAVLVYGYDHAAGTLHIGGFDQVKYSFREVAYDQFEAAIQGIVQHKHQPNSRHSDHHNFTYMLRTDGSSGYRLDLAWIADQLWDYLSSSNTSGRFRSIANQADDYYGLAVYDKLEQYYEQEIRETHEVDLRPLFLLWEHKKIMLRRLAFLEEHGSLSYGGFASPYTAVERKAGNLLNRFIKSRLVSGNSPDYAILGILKELTASMKAEEETILARVLEQINND